MGKQSTNRRKNLRNSEDPLARIPVKPHTVRMNRILPSRGFEPLVYVLTATNFKAARDELNGICDHASRAGWRLEVFDDAMYGFHLDGAEPLARCDGVISHLTDPLRRLPMESFRKPVVVLDNGLTLPAVAWGVVGSDTEAIGRLAAEHLLSLSPASCAFLAEAPEGSAWRWSTARQTAFVHAAEAVGTQVAILAPAEEGVNWVRESPRIGAALASLPRPVGLFCATDVVAKIAYSACRSAGLSVPGDVAILGVDDDTHLCESATPALSSVAIDFFGAGRKAAAMLGEFMAAPRRRPTTVRAVFYGPTGVVRRGSTRPLPAPADPQVARALEFIRQHACEGLHASEVVRWMCVSERKAEYLFAGAGLTIRKALVDARLERVCHELRATDKPIELVSYDCGFSSAIYLANLFRERFGTTMRAYRRVHRPD